MTKQSAYSVVLIGSDHDESRLWKTERLEVGCRGKVTVVTLVFVHADDVQSRLILVH